jgi:hypothetical protein
MKNVFKSTKRGLTAEETKALTEGPVEKSRPILEKLSQWRRESLNSKVVAD